MYADISLAEFEDFDVVVFNKFEGFAIDAHRATLLLFFSNGKRWRHEKYPLGDVRGFSSVDGIEDYNSSILIHNRGIAGAAESIGHNIGEAIKASNARKKAADNTGIVFLLRNVDRPEFMLKMPDSRRRKQIVEGVTQVLEGSKLQSPYIELRPELKGAFQRPRREVTDRVESSTDEHTSDSLPSLKSVAILLALVLVVGLILILLNR